MIRKLRIFLTEMKYFLYSKKKYFPADKDKFVPCTVALIDKENFLNSIIFR